MGIFDTGAPQGRSACGFPCVLEQTTDSNERSGGGSQDAVCIMIKPAGRWHPLSLTGAVIMSTVNVTLSPHSQTIRMMRRVLQVHLSQWACLKGSPHGPSVPGTPDLTTSTAFWSRLCAVAESLHIYSAGEDLDMYYSDTGLQQHQKHRRSCSQSNSELYLGT